MKRAERQYAIVDWLRATAPRPITAARMAEEYGVSRRTIERDLRSLAEAGVPVYATEGRDGGHSILAEHTLPPLRFTAEEAMTLLVGLAAMRSSPFGVAAAAAADKIVGSMPEEERSLATFRAARIRVLEPEATSAEVEEAVRIGLVERRLLALRYRDAGQGGRVTEREVEPLSLLMVRGGWVIVAHCRLRAAIRGFRLDWIESAEVGAGFAPRSPRELRADLDRWRTRSGAQVR